jgi:thiamine biosynthesis lipoprotein
MGTIVSIEIDGTGPPARTDDGAALEAIERAFEWFRAVEACCTRFDPSSELMRLSVQTGRPVPVSALLFEVLQFAVAVAEETDGAFDPTMGLDMERRGFNRDYRTGLEVKTSFPSSATTDYRDVRLDPEQRTVTVRRPLVLDLGAVAKGFAIDLAARELQPFEHFAIDAGGDLYLGGCRPGGAPWSVGIRHPRRDRELLDVVRVSDRAVCTSGDYERRQAGCQDGHHLLDPRRRTTADSVASVTVIAQSAMLADALATAAFVLGPEDGLRLLERHEVEGLLVSPALERSATRRFPSEYGVGPIPAAVVRGAAAILPESERPVAGRARGAHGLGGARHRRSADRAGAH